MNTKLLAALAGAALLTGCSSVQQSYDGHDITVIDGYVKPSVTTVTQVREYLGTPSVTATDKDGNQIVVFTLVGNRPGGSFARNMGKGMLTLGFGSKTIEETAKNYIVKADADGTVLETKANGWAWLQKFRVLNWLECDRQLTEDELRRPINYTIDEIRQTYAVSEAAKRGVPVDEIDVEEEQPFCNIPCHSIRGAKLAFGELTNVDSLVDAREGDGSKFELLYPKKK